MSNNGRFPLDSIRRWSSRLLGLNGQLEEMQASVGFLEAKVRDLNSRQLQLVQRPPYEAIAGQYLPYVSRVSRVDAAKIERLCQQHTRHYADNGLACDFEVYRTVTRTLAESPQVRIVGCGQIGGQASGSGIAVAFRHDVDSDIRAAIKCGAWLQDLKVPGAFYLLHHAMYYGAFAAGFFFRHVGLSELVERLVATGAEVGLHCDPLGVYLGEVTDGAQALREEIAWLRTHGAEVIGVSPHNSALSYHGENFEIFEGWSFMNRTVGTYQGRTYPLQCLNKDALGIRYDATHPQVCQECDPLYVRDYLGYDVNEDLIRNERWLRINMLHNPFYLPGYDVSVWLLGRDMWMLARHWPAPQRELFFPLSTADMLRRVVGQPDGTRVQFNIHPEYVGIF